MAVTQAAPAPPLPQFSGEGDGGRALDPIQVRLAEVVHEGPAFRDGVAEGISLPGQGGAWALTADAPGASYTSPPFELTFPCSHVGVHWRSDGMAGGVQDGLRVEVRSSRDGARWTAWRRVQVEAHGREAASDEARGETFGALAGGRQGTWLQYRLTFGEGWPPGAGIDRVSLTYLEAGRTPPERLGSQPDDTAFAKLGGPAGFLQRVIPREVWGADESLRFVDGKDQWPRSFVSPKLLVVHHTATDNSYPDPAAEVRAIYVYHTVTEGWGDIGYHLLIDDRGQAYEGRLGRDTDPDDPTRREIVSRDVVAGHAVSYNYGSMGIAMLGNFMDAEPSESAMQTLEEALTFAASRYEIDPTGSLHFLRGGTPDGGTDLWHDAMASVSGHRDCLLTECPGDHLYARLPGLRESVAARIGPAGPRVKFAGAPPRNVWPTDLTFTWEGLAGAAQYSTRLEGWHPASVPDLIVPLSGYTPDELQVWGPWTSQRSAAFALPPDASGHYTLLVRARDAAGREGAYVERWPMFVDRHVIADDGDADVRRVGGWRFFDDLRQPSGYGNAYSYSEADPASGAPTATFAWTLKVPEDGMYRVLACWTADDSRATNAHFAIAADGQPVADAEVNQREHDLSWVELGRVPLGAGGTCQVTLTNRADGIVVADAIRLVLV